ncbi:2TM domain-containing protein, partial [candidate division WOR-3 bacterium]|nr:2TM domain-containing protein [candidate division WOR-3 bacterium]
MEENERYRRARERVEEIKSFYSHLFIYIIVNLALFII